MFYCYGVINEHFGNLTLERSDEEGTTFRIVLPQGDQGIVTIEESERFSQATPARIGVVLIPENSAKHLEGIQLRLQNDPTLEIHVVQTEDGLLDATASLQPELIVVHGEHLEAPESTITALKGLLFRGTPEIFVFREESDDICAPPDTIVWEGQLPREEESFSMRFSAEALHQLENCRLEGRKQAGLWCPGAPLGLWGESELFCSITEENGHGCSILCHVEYNAQSELLVKNNVLFSIFSVW